MARFLMMGRAARGNIGHQLLEPVEVIAGQSSARELRRQSFEHLAHLEDLPNLEGAESANDSIAATDLYDALGRQPPERFTHGRPRNGQLQRQCRLIQNEPWREPP